MNERISIIQGDKYIQVEIKAKRNWLLLFLFSLVAIGWLTGSIAKFYQMFIDSAGSEQISSIGELAAWLVFGLIFAYLTSWLAFGKEIVKLTKDSISIKRVIFGFGGVKNYQLKDIDHFRRDKYTGSRFSLAYSLEIWGVAGGNLAFDYQGKKTHKFGLLLEEKDVQKIIKKVKPYLKEKLLIKGNFPDG